VGSIEGSGNIVLGAHNLSVGSNNLSTTFSGVIQDGGENGGSGGSLTKIGTGSLELDNNNTYTGGTAINGGALVVNSLHALGTSDVTLNGGTLQTLSNSPRTFDVGGNYFQNGGTLRIQIGGINSGLNSDLMAVTGAANLSSTLFLHRINNFQPMNGATVTIITAGGGVSGAFNVQNDFPGLLQPNVIYDPNDVMVQFALGSFSGFSGLTPNQRSVAHELDEVANDPAAAALINFLALEPLGNLPHDYDLIAPEELASIYEIGFSQAVVQNDNLQRRMDDIRAGSNGFCANGFVAQVSGKDYTKESDGKVSLPDKSTRDVYTPAPDNRWGVFVTGTGDFVNVGNDDTNAHGYDITTGDFTVGADYRLCDHFAIGIDAGYSRSTADLVDDGRVDVDGGKVGAYATVFGKGLFGSKFYVDGAVGGGFNSYDTRRTGLQDEFVRGSTNGNEFSAMISYGSDWTFGCFNIGTWSTVQYTNVSIDQFTETGSLAPLIIQDQDENSFRTTTGLHASYDIKAGHFIFRPEVRAAYQHEYCDSAYQVDSQLASGAGGVFRVRGPNIGRDAALVGAGINMQWNNRLSTYAYYDGVLGRNNYDNNAISGGFRIGF
jgi:outer membrane autotransporter protein